MTTTARPNPRLGHTLVELTISLAAASMLMVGMGSSVYLSLKASDVSTGSYSDSNDGGHALAQLNRELRLAIALNDAASSSTAVEFTVPDITGDAVNDVIRYAWSGTNGDPLQRTLNGGAPQTVVTNVYGLSLGYHTKSVTISGTATPPVFQEFTEAKVGPPAVTAIDIAKPGGTTSGDLLIAAVALDANPSLASLTAPTGWSVVAKEQFSNNVTFGVWSKSAEGSEPSSYQFTWSGTQAGYGWIMRFTGHDAANPINALNSATQDNSTSPTSPAVTSSVNDALILRLGGFDHKDITIDDPGLTGHTAITMDRNAAGAGSASGGGGYLVQPTAGDSGTSNFTLTAQEQSAMVTIAIAPDPTTGGSTQYFNVSVDSRLQVGSNSASIVYSGVRTINEPQVSAP